MTGVDLVHVPYRGGALALTDLIGGQVQGVRNLAPKHVGRKETSCSYLNFFQGESLTRLAQGAAVGDARTPGQAGGLASVKRCAGNI